MRQRLLSFTQLPSAGTDTSSRPSTSSSLLSEQEHVPLSPTPWISETPLSKAYELAESGMLLRASTAEGHAHRSPPAPSPQKISPHVQRSCHQRHNWREEGGAGRVKGEEERGSIQSGATGRDRRRKRGEQVPLCGAKSGWNDAKGKPLRLGASITVLTPLSAGVCVWCVFVV